MDRFTLDEDAARKWIAGLTGPPGRGDPEVPSEYNPAEPDYAELTGELVSAAHYAGAIAGPGEIGCDWRRDDDGWGYAWLVYLTGAGSLKLSGYHSKLRHLGDGSAPGAEAALGVLRQAVTEANGLLDDLDEYVAERV